jgi:hypothetical protein
MAEVLASLKKIGGSGVSEKYGYVHFKTVAKQTAPSWSNLDGSPKAIWMSFPNPTTANRESVIMNVNPTTGEIDNTELYRSNSNDSTMSPTPITGAYFTVTNNSITYSSQLSSQSNLLVNLMYTYE